MLYSFAFVHTTVSSSILKANPILRRIKYQKKNQIFIRKFRCIDEKKLTIDFPKSFITELQHYSLVVSNHLPKNKLLPKQKFLLLFYKETYN